MRLLWILLVILAGSVAGFLFTRFEGDAPVIQTLTAPVAIGKEHVHSFRVTDEGTGVERVRVWLVAGGKRQELADDLYPGNFFLGADLPIERQIEVTLRPADLGLADGPAELVAEARDYSWRGNVSTVSVPLRIDTRPPRVTVLTGLTYARRGGSELATYQTDESTVRDGVQVGQTFFPGFVHPQVPDRRLAFFALPASSGPIPRPAVVAEDQAGNRTRVELDLQVIERSFPSDEIHLSRSFIARKFAELVGGDPGADLAAAYLQINREMRQRNAEQIREICAHSGGERLWTESFLQLPNSRVGARFGERRTYRYEEKVIDREVHLGYDLASTSHAVVPAANDGVVVFAGPLGIYGNVVVLDHGLGLFSLYGHLSQIGAEKGSPVARGDPIGHTGQTGLAGGDHLHFSMLVDGHFVDPLEWFDARWIREHLESDLAAPASAPS